MGDDTFSVRLNLSTGEIEVRGSEQFISQVLGDTETLERVATVLDRFSGDSTLAPNDADGESITSNAFDGNEGADDIPGEIGEWLVGFPMSDLTQAEQALLAAYYLSETGEREAFSSQDVAGALDRVGLNISNPPRELNKLADQQYIYKTGESGQIKLYKMHLNGREAVENMVSGEE